MRDKAIREDSCKEKGISNTKCEARDLGDTPDKLSDLGLKGKETMPRVGEYKMLDMESYPRKKHFEYFCAMQDPNAGITAKVDVSRVIRFCNERKCSFYSAFIHIVALAANAVPELRQRVDNGGIREYTKCGTSHIELLENGTYCYCTLYHNMDWDQYLLYAEKMRQKYTSNPSIEEEEDVDGLYFITTLPWLHYEQISMPVTGTGESNPRICWGKYEEDFRGRKMMPLTLIANHALLDGIHFAAFFKKIEEEIERLP